MVELLVQIFMTNNKCGASNTNCYYSKEGEPTALLEKKLQHLIYLHFTLNICLAKGTQYIRNMRIF